MTRADAILYAENKLKMLSRKEETIGYVTDDSIIELRKEMEFLQIAICNMKLARTYQIEELETMKE